MLFASATFLYYFLPAFLALYYLTPRGARSFTLAIASYVFYGWWRPDFLILMLVSTLVDFTAGERVHRARQRDEKGKPWLVLSLCTNLGLLAYFKYANFGIETLNSLLGATGQDPIVWTAVVLPVGISFYTFQTLSYTVDVYRGTTPPVARFRDFMCYVAMFPQLVAGPIVRYNTVADQLANRTHTRSKFFQGVLAFQAGLAKKVLIADVLAGVADRAFGADQLTTMDAWAGSLAYTFQIYFDFSGYSDMAIGLGLMIGFRLPINFDSPYHSRSITEFWRRWHVSLSTFLRDYLYLPLGGNRKGPLRTYVNLATVMLLGGLWHGAAWTFLAWGAYQGFWLIVERLAGKRSLYGSAPRVLQIAATFVLVIFGWVLFRASDMNSALDILGSMLGFASDSAHSLPLLVRPIHLVATAAALIVVWGFPTTQSLVARPPNWWVLALQLLFPLALAHMHYEQNVPFLYFQF
ncbi:MAG: alginate O-acetyltransferase complex protein AlgI [Planctomycetota bacterium]|jgi:alginate O-acetyltransferase complex protein AlgI